jgi:hypothetical protein
MPLTPPLHLHLGWPKTATSTLQEIYFCRHPEIDYFALQRKGGAYPNGGRFDNFVRWVRESPDLDTGRDRHRSYLRWELGRRMRTGTRCRLLSEERFTGHFGAGIEAKAKLAFDLFPGAHVMLTVRHPVGLMVSSYLQHLRHPRPGMPPLPLFDAWVRDTFDHAGQARSYANTLRYADIVARYERLFGRENVAVFVYEAFRDQPEVFLERLAGWLGIDGSLFLRIRNRQHRVVNPSPSRPQFALWYLRQQWLNRGRSVAGALLNRGARIAGRIPWQPALRPSEASRRRIEAFAAPQCGRLSGARGLDLERFGYPVS